MPVSHEELQRMARREKAARLAAPVHNVQNRFEQHERVEGYLEDRSAPDFLGCDRLLKWDTLYGTVQLGYDPKRGQSFLFANLKTSIYDSAPSQDQRQMRESGRMFELKSGNSNRVYSARRRPGSAVLLYNAENRPWSEQSLRPYLRRQNLEAFGRTLPFLNAGADRRERASLLETDRTLRDQERGQRGEALSALRAQRTALSHEADAAGALIWRKQAQARLFFRRVNLNYDLQKQAIFAYYRSRMEERKQEPQNVPVEPDEEKKP